MNNIDCLIYVGSSLPEKKNLEYVSLGSSGNFASIALQNSLLDGFYSLDLNLRIISGCHVDAYPKTRKIVFEKEEIDFKGKSNIYTLIPWINLPILNMLSRFLNIRRQLKKLLKSEKGNKTVILYEIHTPYLLAAVSLRKYINKSCLIVPDLPEYMSGNKSWMYKFLKKIDRNIIDWCLKRIDSFVLLSEYMRERLPISDKPWMVMEGIYNDKYKLERIQKEKDKVILYTGNIDERKGIKTLIDAFLLIKDDRYKLWIRGDGDYKEKILEITKENKRIVYFEPVSREEILRMERVATVLVNPALRSMTFTKYFFPSKTMEYLASGTPIVMFKLDCMPVEYSNHIYYVEGDDYISLKNKLVEICEKPESQLMSFGCEAQEFVIKRKNPNVQCSRIYNFLQHL